MVKEKNKMIAKTGAQRAKEYRERQKAKKLNQLLMEDVDRRQSTSTKTSDEYLKEYRRKKRLRNKSIQLNSLLTEDHSNAKKRKTGDVHHLLDTKKFGSQIGFQASQITYRLEVPVGQSGLQDSVRAHSPEVLQRNSFQAPYEQHSDCVQPQAIYYHDTEIISDGNCFFFSVIKIMNLPFSPVQIRQQLLTSPFINSCINPNGARSILESETEYAEMDCIEIFARVYNQNVCVHNHYVNTKTGREERQFFHFKINDSRTFIHLHLCDVHFTPLIETTAIIVSYRLHEENDKDFNDASDDVNDATPYMDIDSTNVTISIYTKYHEHAAGHLKFYNIFKSNTFGHSCAVCDRLWWKRDLKKSTDIHDNVLRKILQNYVSGNAVEICETCKKSLDKGKIPLLAVHNGFSFPAIPNHLQKLNLIEQRLISPRIPFMQIRRFKHVHGEYGISGQIIHVPVEVNTMVNQLPRNIDDDDCFYAHIKKKLIHKSSNVHGLISKGHIKQWLLYLIKTPLYVHENITINEDLLNSYGVDTEVSIDDTNEHVAVVDNLRAQQQTLMWNEDKMFHMAPGKRSIPNSILFDVNAEELSFPTIYGGQFRTYRDGCNFTSLMQVTSELRRTDRRAADPQHLLYVAAKIMWQQVSSSVSAALRHVELDNKITKEDVQSEDYINNFIETNLDFLRCIPNSAWYWAVQKKDLFAIMKQFGAPTAFMTLSANETGWSDLLKLLYKLKNNGAEIEDESLSEMSYVHKAQLVNEDAVTCVIYFHKLVICLLKILQSKKGSPFGKYRVKDYFKRIEFQYHGSPRAHILLWLDNVPEDLLNNCKSFTDMVDTLVSVSESEASGNIKLQTHKHTLRCYKKMDQNKNDKCRFGAPFFPSRNTITLMPMKCTDSDYCIEKFEEYKKHYALLKTNLENNNYEDFDHFYAENNIVSDKHYYDIIRAGIVRPKLLYRRTPSQKWHNNFNPFVFHCLKSNMDIQIIQDEYTCAAYIFEYVNKHNKGISNLQRLIIQAMDENPQFYIVDITKKLSIDLLHAVEMSAQEAAWYLMREPIAKSSVVTAYIPTIYPTERQNIRKTLSDLDDDCTNILKENWFDMYEKRPENLENVTLAQFVAKYNNKKNGEYYEKKTSRVIRYRNYDKENNFNDYRREMVLLYIPFRSEDNDVLAENKFIQIYEDNKDLIRERRKEYESDLDIGKILEICRQFSLEDDEDEQLQSEMNVTFEADPYGRLLQDANSVVNADAQHATLSKLGSVAEKREYLINTEQFNDLIRSTKSEQLMHIISHLQNLNQQPFQIFFTGPAGSGKSFVIKVIMNIYNSFSDSDGYCNAYLACASTGKVAVAVDGTTVYAALQISISKLLPLSSEMLHLYRSLFKHVKLLIIDEISIVRAKLLAKIDLCLKQITGSYNEDFGGIDVILIHDSRQAPPVKVTSIKTRMLGPHFWRSLKFLQLTQVMKQANAKFSSIVKKIGNGEVLEDFEFELIESRFFKLEEAPRLCPNGDPKSCNVDYDNRGKKLGVDDEIEPPPFDFVQVEPSSDHESVDEFAKVKSKCYEDYDDVNNIEEAFISNNKANSIQESVAKSSNLNYDNVENKLVVKDETDPLPPDIFPVTIKQDSSSDHESVVKSLNVNYDNVETKLGVKDETDPLPPDMFPVIIKQESSSDHESDAKSSNVNYDNGVNKLGVKDETDPLPPDMIPVTIKGESTDHDSRIYIKPFR